MALSFHDRHKNDKVNGGRSPTSPNETLVIFIGLKIDKISLKLDKIYQQIHTIR